MICCGNKLVCCRKKIYFLWEQDNKLLEQDIILREQNNKKYARMTLISHRTIVILSVEKECYTVHVQH